MSDTGESNRERLIRFAIGAAILGLLIFVAMSTIDDAREASEQPPECPGDPVYCDRATYVADVAPICASTAISEKDRNVIELTTTVAAFCECMAGAMYDRFATDTLWRFRKGKETVAERERLISIRAEMANDCLRNPR